MANIPGIAERGVLSLGQRIPRPLAGQVFGELDPWNKAKLMATSGGLEDPIPLFDTNSGTHVGFEFLNPRSGRIELRNRDGAFLSSYPRTEKPNIRDKLLGVQLFAILAGTYYKYFNSPPQPAPPQIEDNFVDKIQELKQKGILPDVEVGEEEDPRAFGEPEDFSGPILDLTELLGTSLPALEVNPTAATKERAIDGLLDPKTKLPPLSFGPDLPITGEPPLGRPFFGPRGPITGEPPLGQPGPITAEARAAALNNMNRQKKMVKQNQAFERFDSLQTKTATQRIANLETPLHDYSQSGSRMRGLQPGNRPVII